MSEQDQPRTLVVDLDGTLIRSDLLFESFIATFRRSLVALFRACLSLFSGRAAFKAQLSVGLDVQDFNLQFNQPVLDLIESHRRSGGKVALVTASRKRSAKPKIRHRHRHHWCQ